ncbi:hypothetical protein LNTAR_22509 [Lentisphaera araneosa HTCC2155]|uniref:Uncharacterized protein n=1 Tax=Lentisphaera araneosa HTCC2155 TaxID=313628 RepID=A6DG93_9BACT|nr:hypothetical protein LNTAR_22509 [Lentisphaera araneosa HTCC2155]
MSFYNFINFFAEFVAKVFFACFLRYITFKQMGKNGK